MSYSNLAPESEDGEREPGIAAPLLDRTTDAFAWRLGTVLSTLVLQFAVAVVLAHLLRVRDFGLLSLALIVTGLVSRISQIGLGPALIQRRELTATHIRVGFTWSVLIGMLLTAVIWAGAPLAASLLSSDPAQAEEVTPILRLIAVAFLFTGFGTTAEALLERKLDYKRLFEAELVSYAVGYGIVGITLALLDYGVWALAWPPVVQALLKTGLLFILSPHVAWPSFARVEARHLLQFGAGVSLVRIANQVALTGDYFVVGRLLGVDALGLYSRAYQLMTLPLSKFSTVANTVLFPAYSAMQNEPERLRRGYLGAVSLSALVVFPLLTSLGIAAPELIAGVFGDQWTGAIVPLQILCIGGAFRSIYGMGDSLARAKGALSLQFCCQSIYALCVIGASVGGSRWEITGVAIGVVGAIAVMYLLAARLSLYLIGASWGAFFLSQLPGAILATAVAGLVLPVAIMLRAAQLHNLVILASTLLLSLVVALTAGRLLPRRWHDPAALGAVHRLERRCAATVNLVWHRYRRKENQGHGDEHKRTTDANDPERPEDLVIHHRGETVSKGH